jgi:hypothetical protein
MHLFDKIPVGLILPLAALVALAPFVHKPHLWRN